MAKTRTTFITKIGSTELMVLRATLKGLLGDKFTRVDTARLADVIEGLREQLRRWTDRKTCTCEVFAHGHMFDCPWFKADQLRSAQLSPCDPLAKRHTFAGGVTSGCVCGEYPAAAVPAANHKKIT